MKKFIPFLLLFCMCACQNKKANPEQSESKMDSAAAISAQISPATPAHFMATHLINFDLKKIQSTHESIDVEALIKKKDRALFLLDSVVNTEDFKNAVIHGNFTHRNGMSNEQIYDSFVSQSISKRNIREHLTLEIDTTYEWNVTNQKGPHPSVGYDNNPGDSTVNTVQVQLLKELSAEDYAAHIAHEYCHMIGFSHPWPGKWKGVPYCIQHIIENLLDSRADDISYQ